LLRFVRMVRLPVNTTHYKLAPYFVSSDAPIAAELPQHFPPPPPHAPRYSTTQPTARRRACPSAFAPTFYAPSHHTPFILPLQAFAVRGWLRLQRPWTPFFTRHHTQRRPPPQLYLAHLLQHPAALLPPSQPPHFMLRIWRIHFVTCAAFTLPACAFHLRSTFSHHSTPPHPPPSTYHSHCRHARCRWRGTRTRTHRAPTTTAWVLCV